MSADEQKRRAAQAALEYVESGMVLGLGTGSTAAWFVKLLGARVRDGLDVKGVPTSEETRRLADAEGVPLVEPDETLTLDLDIDGADECDGRLDLIKGGGGALLREKIVAGASRRMIVIADASKHVAQLGRFPLPVEIDRFAFPFTVRRVREALAEAGLGGAKLALRPRKGDPGAFVSDGGNYILDVRCERIPDAPALDARLRAIPGVVETGFFIATASVAIFGTDAGVEVLTRDRGGRA